MFATQRTEKILEMLYRDETVLVNELVKFFNVSDVTIRKDLKKLDSAGVITKIHGGAVLKKDIITPPKSTSDETILTKPKKDVLAKFVCEHIKNGDTIFLGSGYSCVSFAKQLLSGLDISVITHNIEAVPYLKGKCKTLILLGGEVITHEGNFFAYSSESHEEVRSYNINKAITSCSGVDNNFGISCCTEASKKIISEILKNSQSWYLIADSTKFNNVSPYKIADTDTPEMIVTESLLEEYKKFKNITECRV